MKWLCWHIWLNWKAAFTSNHPICVTSAAAFKHLLWNCPSSVINCKAQKMCKAGKIHFGNQSLKAGGHSFQKIYHVPWATGTLWRSGSIKGTETERKVIWQHSFLINIFLFLINIIPKNNLKYSQVTQIWRKRASSSEVARRSVAPGADDFNGGWGGWGRGVGGSKSMRGCLSSLELSCPL